MPLSLDTNLFFNWTDTLSSVLRESSLLCKAEEEVAVVVKALPRISSTVVSNPTTFLFPQLSSFSELNLKHRGSQQNMLR